MHQVWLNWLLAACGAPSVRYYIFTFIIIFQVRLPPNTSDDVDEDPTGNKALWDRGLLNGASQKVKPLVIFFFEIYEHRTVAT